MLFRSSFNSEDWHRADLLPGDLLLFGVWTPHCGLPNDTDRLRLSVDFRVQPPGMQRPIIGVVVEVDEGSISIATEGSGVRTITLDGLTVLRQRTYGGPEPVDPRGYLGQRVVAVAEHGRAIVIRYPRDYVPGIQVGEPQAGVLQPGIQSQVSDLALPPVVNQ